MHRHDPHYGTAVDLVTELLASIALSVVLLLLVIGACL
jgi:hypothetical protein